MTRPPAPGFLARIGTYHTHAGGFEMTGEMFLPDDRLKATLGKEYSYLAAPRRRILKFTPIPLLGADELAANPLGKIEVLRMPVVPPESATREALYGRWTVSRPGTGDTWDVIFSCIRRSSGLRGLAGTGPSSKDLAAVRLGRRLVARKIEGAAANGIERFVPD